VKKIFRIIFFSFALIELYGDDDKIWGFWFPEPDIQGTRQELKLEFEYHLEKNNGFESDAYFQYHKQLLENYTIYGTMAYPGNGGIFLIINIEIITRDEYILSMINNIDSESPIPAFSEGTIRMVFLDEDTVYFATVSDDESGTYNHFFRGPNDLKYRAMVTDAYYPERAGIPRYTQIQEERKRLEEQKKVVEQEEHNEIKTVINEGVTQQPGTALSLIIALAAAGVLLAAVVVVLLVRQKKRQ
jgi:hypothetical protein